MLERYKKIHGKDSKLLHPIDIPININNNSHRLVAFALYLSGQSDASKGEGHYIAFIKNGD